MNAKTMWPLYVHTIHWHDFFLYLPRPLQSGHTYVVRVETDKERDARFKYEWRLDYDEKKTTTKVIKINQIAYSAMAKRRYAYIGWWAGDRGKVEFTGLGRFDVIDEKRGQPSASSTRALQGLSARCNLYWQGNAYLAKADRDDTLGTRLSQTAGVHPIKVKILGRPITVERKPWIVSERELRDDHALSNSFDRQPCVDSGGE